MSNLIDRQAVLDALIFDVRAGRQNGKTLMVRYAEEVIKRIKELPSAQPGEDIRAMCGECDAWNQYKNYPQPQWIPCSKKLPEPNRSVLVQLSDDFVDPIQIMTLDISKLDGDFFCFWRTQEMGIIFDMDDVVAWMPSPKPWKGEKP